MSIGVARLILTVVGAYVAAGVIFGVAFLTVGIGRIDPSATGSSWGFRVLITPGVVALWPLLAWRWMTGKRQPPQPSDAHRRSAQRVST